MLVHCHTEYPQNGKSLTIRGVERLTSSYMVTRR